jgi:hypothetical protein
MPIGLLIQVSCNNGPGRTQEYDIKSYFTAQQRDTLMADIITYVYKKPKTADYITRFSLHYRNWYVQNLPLFDLAYYYISDDSTHYYYLIRPARSAKGSTRGVGGSFKLNSEGKIIHFEELFNTPVMATPYLKQKGLILFKEMVASGDVDGYLGNPEFIEWPDDRLKYDNVKNEWRYDVE